MTDKWFVVWNELGAPAVKHDSISQAIDEAMRLARHNPGQRFHVLALVGTAKKVDVVFDSVDGEDIVPF